MQACNQADANLKSLGFNILASCPYFTSPLGQIYLNSPNCVDIGFNIIKLLAMPLKCRISSWPARCTLFAAIKIILGMELVECLTWEPGVSTCSSA